MKHIILLLLLVGQTFLVTAQKQPPFITDSLDAYIKRGMSDWQIPGLAIAVVKDG